MADFRENVLKNFLCRYFPFPHRIAKGNVIDSSGNESDSIDCILVNPAHPHTIDSQNKFTVILADGVDAAIELKPDLQDRSELKRGIEQIASLKRCVRANSPVIFKSQAPGHLVEHAKRIPAFLFTSKVKSDVHSTIHDILEIHRDGSMVLEDQFDFIVVNRRGIISNYKHRERSMANGKTGLVWEQWNDSTLAAFLYKLVWTYPAVIRMSSSPIEHYVRDIYPEKCISFE